jgi:RNA polymerase sigma-70 factor, ECF subfamily
MAEAELTDASEPEAFLHPELAQDVLDRLPARDPDALRQFFDAYFERVFGFVRRLVDSEHQAEDLTQDIFLQLYQGFPKYDPTRDLRPWVFTVAANKLRDFWRSRRHRETRRERSVDRDEDDDGLGLELPAATPRPEDDLSAAERARSVREAVDALPEGMRMTVLLRVYEGLSFEEIGSILSRNSMAVRKRYSRALEVLRKTMEREAPGGD